MSFRRFMRNLKKAGAGKKLYSISIPTEAAAIQATVEWRDARPDMVVLHVGDFIHELGTWCRMSKDQARQLVVALNRAIDHKP